MSIETNKKFNLKRSTLLGGVLSNNFSGVIEDGQYRRYVGSLQSKCVINGLMDTNEKSILYELGVRESFNTYWKRFKKDSMSEDPKIPRIGQSFQVLNVFDEEITALHKKISNFDGRYEYMDLSAIVYNLALGISEFNNTGRLATADLRRGQNINVRALNTAFDPVTSSPNSLFIPRMVDRIMNPATFCAIAASANAYGTSVFTDMVEIDGAGATLLTDYSDGALFDGCVEGIRLIFSMLDRMEAASICCFALIKGLHTLTTVVAHSDEGGLFRDILRVAEFVPPYGAIYFNDTRNFIAFPVPSSRDLTAVCAVIDSMLLISAAGVSVCDPCVNIDGRIYPTIFTNSNTGTEDEKMVANRISNKGKLSSVGNDFFKKYSDFCANMFGLTDNNSDKVLLFLQNSLTALNVTGNRHLAFETIAPYFFIEPTSLFNNPYGDVAESNNYGALSFLSNTVTMPLFEGIGLIQDLGQQKLFGINFRNMRNNGLFLHNLLSPKDGLANWIPFNFVHENFCLTGGADTPLNYRNNGNGFDRYTWGRGQSSLFHPAECNYVGKQISVKAIFSSIDGAFDVTTSHIPRATELNGNVELTAIRPYRVANGPISTWTKKIRKERTNAATALEKANQIKYSHNFTGGFALVPGNTEPVEGDYKPLDVDIRGEAVDPDDDSGRGSFMVKGPAQSVVYSDQVAKINAKPKQNKTLGVVSTEGNRKSQRILEKNNKEIVDEEMDILVKPTEPVENVGIFGSGLNISGSGNDDSLPKPQGQ